MTIKISLKPNKKLLRLFKIAAAASKAARSAELLAMAAKHRHK